MSSNNPSKPSKDNEGTMNHSDFVEKYNSNLIAVNVDRNKAGFIYEQPGLIPQQFRSLEGSGLNN